MSTPLPDDLKDFEAPSWWRTHGHKVWASIFFALLAVSMFVPREPAEYRGPTVSGKIRPAATVMPYDCPRLRDGLWLRVMVKHTNHTGFAWHQCYYGKLDREDIL